MLDALTDITEPQAEKAPTVLSCIVSDREVENAIQKTFPFEGDLRIRHLWSGQDVARYRANWFRQVSGENRIVTSMFLSITRTVDGLVVLDETAVGK